MSRRARAGACGRRSSPRGLSIFGHGSGHELLPTDATDAQSGTCRAYAWPLIRPVEASAFGLRIRRLGVRVPPGALTGSDLVERYQRPVEVLYSAPGQQTVW